MPAAHITCVSGVVHRCPGRHAGGVPVPAAQKEPIEQRPETAVRPADAQ